MQLGAMALPETDIFISYSREDRAKARVVATCLEREGFVVWWDAAIHSGESFDMVIERQLAEAKAVIVLWSPKSVNSRWVRAEASSADRSGKLVPVVIEPCTRPIIFELLHTIELIHWNGDVADPAWEQFLLDLHRTIRSKRQQAGAVEAAPSPAANPVISPAASPSAFPSFAATDDDDEDEAYEATQFSAFEPAPQGPEHFLHLVVNGRAEKQFPIGAGLHIGRTAPAEVILADPHVSRRHCRVELDGDDLIVHDLGSTNGTFVDDEKVVGQAILPVGSVLKIGQCELVHELRTSALA
ncbi:TIR domain-containing protein [Altererythrobacter sp. Z27]|uniref:TIR domain-containing protein n=1 Tax=Altererythrobacter sp. Z27 TaxID=3461147 RepID=UPI004044E3E9